MTVHAVLDVNVFISSLIARLGIPRRLWNAWRYGQFVLISSDPIIDTTGLTGGGLGDEALPRFSAVGGEIEPHFAFVGPITCDVCPNFVPSDIPEMFNCDTFPFVSAEICATHSAAYGLLLCRRLCGGRHE